MNKKETLKFIKLWNKKNGYKNGNETIEPNMRYAENGKVAWNEYDSPIIDIEEIVEIYCEATYPDFNN
jgi:hypothetical protein